jgi:hypothetical protein
MADFADARARIQIPKLRNALLIRYTALERFSNMSAGSTHMILDRGQNAAVALSHIKKLDPVRVSPLLRARPHLDSLPRAAAALFTRAPPHLPPP